MAFRYSSANHSSPGPHLCSPGISFTELTIDSFISFHSSSMFFKVHLFLSLPLFPSFVSVSKLINCLWPLDILVDLPVDTIVFTIRIFCFSSRLDIGFSPPTRYVSLFPTTLIQLAPTNCSASSVLVWASISG